MIPIFSVFGSLLTGRAFSNISSGLRCYVLHLVKDPSVDIDQAWLDRYELEHYLQYKAVRSHRYRMVEVPVKMHRR